MLSSIDIAKEVIQIEVEGLLHMESRIGPEFDVAVKAILNTQGRTIICGMGKSGIIGKKIAASFASTGTPSFFMHPGEAFHGDLGMVTPEDIFIAISNSGETDEVLKLLPFLRDNKNIVIAITGNKNSTLANKSMCHLDTTVPKEACPHQLAPTASTTAALVMGDALTVALMNERSFKPENFARFHPGGSLGRRLLRKVRDEMHSSDLPILAHNDTFYDVINRISIAKLGLAIVKFKGKKFGVITDGDIRKAMDTNGKNAFELTAEEFASKNPILIKPDVSMDTAYELMIQNSVSSLIVFDGTEIVGILKK
jgi:arabinose-5-phosphate isomerase